MDTLQLHLGEYEAAIDAAVERATADKLVERIWGRDHRIWHPQADEISDRLGWLDIAERMQAEIPHLKAFADEVIQAGIGQVLLLGMGGSSLAPEVLSKIIGPAPGYPSLDVLDSTDPEMVRQSTRRFPPAQTLYVVSTKSGGTEETLSLFKHFYNQAQEALGPEEAGARFVAITDPGSKLVELARQHSYRRIFANDPYIGGRYSALSYVGLVPAAVLGLDMETLLGRAVDMAERCKQDEAQNPGVRLGLALAVLAKQGRDKLTFLAPEALLPFGDWAEQLIAESSGKDGTGILPVVGEPLTAGRYGDDRAFVHIASDDSDAGGAAEDQPRIECHWQDENDLGAEFFLWEFATAVAGHGLGIHPFNQPNVEAAKEQARQFTARYIEHGQLPQANSEPLSAAALEAFLSQAQAGDYIALQAYLPSTEANTKALQGLRGRLLERYKLATTLGYGPRFLHSTGQLHKGDGGRGLFVQLLTPPPEDDVPIPLEAGKTDSQISFGVLKVAQALGDAQALRAAGRRVVTFELDDPVSEIRALAEGIHG